MIQISINRRPESLAVELYVYEKTQTHITYYHPENDTTVATTVEYHEGAVPEIKPFAVLHEQQFRQMVHAFVEHARDEGMRGGEESHAKGKLEATERHLEDMRALVFEPRKKFVITTDEKLSGIEL